MCDTLHCTLNLINPFTEGAPVLAFIIKSGYGLSNISRITEIPITNGTGTKAD